jgi:hypothetical protein
MHTVGGMRWVRNMRILDSHIFWCHPDAHCRWREVSPKYEDPGLSYLPVCFSWSQYTEWLHNYWGSWTLIFIAVLQMRTVGGVQWLWNMKIQDSYFYDVNQTLTVDGVRSVRNMRIQDSHIYWYEPVAHSTWNDCTNNEHPGLSYFLVSSRCTLQVVWGESEIWGSRTLILISVIQTHTVGGMRRVRNMRIQDSHICWCEPVAHSTWNDCTNNEDPGLPYLLVSSRCTL